MTSMPQHHPDAGIRHDLYTPFGTFTVEAQDVIAFPSGIPGFEECRQFVLLSPPDLGGLRCLQSIEGPAASFFVIDPSRVLGDYRSVLSQTDRMRLGAGEDSALLWLAIVSFDRDDRAHANLRAPVVINPERMLGFQVMPHNSLYPLRHPLPTE
jgi:flagellar assembly factor FliW